MSDRFAPIWIGIFIAAIIAYREFNRYISKEKLFDLIDKAYQTENCKIILVNKLKLNEKIRHSVHMNFFIHFQVTLRQLFGPNENEIFRKVEYKDSDDINKTDILRLLISAGEINEFETLESYNF